MASTLRKYSLKELETADEAPKPTGVTTRGERKKRGAPKKEKAKDNEAMEEEKQVEDDPQEDYEKTKAAKTSQRKSK